LAPGQRAGAPGAPSAAAAPPGASSAAVAAGATRADGKDHADPVAIAERGVANVSEPLPRAPTLQPLFGRHDLSGIRAQVGGPAADAARALGATAYAVGDRVGFGCASDLATAAHEAAHVIASHTRGASGAGGARDAGEAGGAGVVREAERDAGRADPNEQHADVVADTDSRGENVEALIDGARAIAGTGAAIQRAAVDAAHSRA
jgi:hypothetical protein